MLAVGLLTVATLAKWKDEMNAKKMAKYRDTIERHMMASSQLKAECSKLKQQVQEAGMLRRRVDDLERTNDRLRAANETLRHQAKMNSSGPAGDRALAKLFQDIQNSG